MSLDEALAAHMKAIQGMVAESSGTIDHIAGLVAACFEGGGKLLVCGNGGSAADAQHLAAEFVNRMRHDREAWPSIALTTDASVLTSIANDSSYADVFARQVRALGRPGDVLIALSTSGSAASVIAALKTGREQGLTTVGFTGQAGADSMGAKCDLLLVVPSPDTARIQECHEFAYHEIAAMVETTLMSHARGIVESGS